MTTDELIRELRLYAEQHQDNSAFLLGLIYQAADRLEELEERVAIMSEPTATDALNNIKSAFDDFCKDADEMISKNKTDP